MNSLIKYLDCGIYYSKNSQVGHLVVTNFSNNNEKIIPFFSKYPPRLATGGLDYLDFCKAAELIKNKVHLTEEGLNEIIRIKEGMNRGRKF